MSNKPVRLLRYRDQALIREAQRLGVDPPVTDTWLDRLLHFLRLR